MTALCATRPADWWSPEDDGARLALALCQVCPSIRRCAELDPEPHGVIRAGVAYSDTGRALPACPDCRYPLLGQVGRHVQCGRCDVPRLARWRADILRWREQGIGDAAAGRRLGATSEEIRDIHRPRRGQSAPAGAPLQAVA